MRYTLQTEKKSAAEWQLRLASCASSRRPQGLRPELERELERGPEPELRPLELEREPKRGSEREREPKRGSEREREPERELERGSERELKPLESERERERESE